jgi:cation diffusion facilitator family transporter
MTDLSADDPGRILLQKGAAVARRSTLVLVVLSIAKGTVGLLSGSIALLADAAHTVMDIAGSSIVWLGLRLSLRKPSDRFSYGFYKAESICALIVCIIMILTGAEILRDSVERFYVPSVISSRPVVIAVAIGSGIVSYFLARYKKKAGREINSEGLKVESKHSLADVLDSGLVCGGIVFTYLNVFWVEPLAAVIISLFLLWTAFTFGKDSISAHVVADEVEDRVKQRFKEVDSMTVHWRCKCPRKGTWLNFGARTRRNGTASST